MEKNTQGDSAKGTPTPPLKIQLVIQPVTQDETRHLWHKEKKKKRKTFEGDWIRAQAQYVSQHSADNWGMIFNNFVRQHKQRVGAIAQAISMRKVFLRWDDSVTVL